MPDTAEPVSLPGRTADPTRRPAAPLPRRLAARACAALFALTPVLAGCAPPGEPATFAVPPAAAARIRMICPPDTFIGTMTANCPRPLSPRAPAE